MAFRRTIYVYLFTCLLIYLSQHCRVIWCVRQSSMALKLNRCTNWITWIFTEASDANYFSAPELQWIAVHRRSRYTGGSARATRATFFSGIMYLMKNPIYSICSGHRNDHRTSSIDCDLHKLMNTILCEVKNVKDLLSLSPLIIINNILFYLAF